MISEKPIDRERLLATVEKGRRAKWWRRKGSKSRGFKYFDHAGRLIRDDDSLEAALKTGARRVNVGTAALEHPDWVRGAIGRHGDRVLVSGTGPVMPDGGCPESTLEQARRCWEIVGKALNEAGVSFEDVIRTRTFLTPNADPQGAMDAHGEVFKDIRPASSMVEVSRLIDPAMLVEVEVVAYRPGIGAAAESSR